jgi:DNA-binding IclR family transcriptional regulator
MSSGEVVERYIAQATTGRGADQLADPDGFRDEIALTRLWGYSIGDGQVAPGVRSLGVAVHEADGAPLFAISLTGRQPD